MSASSQGFVPENIPCNMIVCGKRVDSHLRHFEKIQTRSRYLASRLATASLSLQQITDELINYYEEVTNVDESWNTLAGINRKLNAITTEHLRFKNDSDMVKLRLAMDDLLFFMRDALITIGQTFGAPPNEVYDEYLKSHHRQKSNLIKMRQRDALKAMKEQAQA